MKKVLLLYATREGQTRKVAERIALHLSDRGADVELVNASDLGRSGSPDLSAYDLLVFGASMHAGGLEAEIVDFINGSVDRIRLKPHSFFLVLLSAATRDANLRDEWLADARAKMDSQLRLHFTPVEMIAGALPYSRYSPPLKWVMQRIARKGGGDTDTGRDYEYTDWDQVRRYADTLLSLI